VFPLFSAAQMSAGGYLLSMYVSIVQALVWCQRTVSFMSLVFTV
jgi:hypothetical protein